MYCLPGYPPNRNRIDASFMINAITSMKMNRCRPNSLRHHRARKLYDRMNRLALNRASHQPPTATSLRNCSSFIYIPRNASFQSSWKWFLSRIARNVPAMLSTSGLSFFSFCKAFLASANDSVALFSTFLGSTLSFLFVRHSPTGHRPPLRGMELTRAIMVRPCSIRSSF